LLDQPVVDDLDLETDPMTGLTAALIVIACLLLWAIGPSLPQGIAQHPERLTAYLSSVRE